MTTRTPDQDAIEACVQKYFDGIGQHDIDLVGQPFHPQALMSSIREGEFSMMPAGESVVAYMKVCAPIQESSPNFVGRIEAVYQQDTMAAVIAAEDALEGANFTTYFHLHKIDGEWLITAKATYGAPM